MVVPLSARGRTLGAMTLVFAESGRRYTDLDLHFAEELARRCAVAIDNARLFISEQRARQNADVASRAKDEFLAVVSHELRTPLNAILGWAKMMSSPAFDEARRGRAVETIERNAAAMAQLIEDLLDMSRIISGKMRLDVQRMELAPVVDAAIESVRPAADAKEIRVLTVFDSSIPEVVGDPTRIQQVVWNLLSNAVKFTPKGGRVEVLLTLSDSWAAISVADTGRGIAERFLPHVFDPFRQEDASSTRSRGGLGLGLAITRQLVELHGGRIHVESGGEGRGATFRVLLPISAVARTSSRPPTSGALEKEARVAPARRPELEGLRVLVVDDEKDARQLVQAVLEDCGCRVTLAAGVDAAMGALGQEVPDVIISDIGMPERDGYDLIRQVRALPRPKGGDVPAAALTAYARAEDRLRMLAAGYSMHLAKPIDPQELVVVVASLTRFAPRSRA
jgi:signal transduction histidine kinase/CheY-like chemotaxis protein